MTPARWGKACDYLMTSCSGCNLGSWDCCGWYAKFRNPAGTGRQQLRACLVNSLREGFPKVVNSYQNQFSTYFTTNAMQTRSYFSIDTTRRNIFQLRSGFLSRLRVKSQALTCHDPGSTWKWVLSICPSSATSQSGEPSHCGRGWHGTWPAVSQWACMARASNINT